MERAKRACGIIFRCILAAAPFFWGCSSSSPAYDGGQDHTTWDVPDGADWTPDIPWEGSDLVCTPGEVICTGTMTFNRCLPDGSGWENDLTCPSGTSCMGGGCYTPCSYAERNRSSIGCMFYALDLDQYDDGTYDFDGSPYAIVVSNIDDTFTATVTVEQKTTGTWSTIMTESIPPNSLFTFRLSADAHVEETYLIPGVAYRVVSDYPVIAYQFNPIDTADQMSNDASMLLPVHTLDNFYFAASWHEFSMNDPLMTLNLRGFVAIAGTQDGTSVSITPSAPTSAGGSVPALSPGVPYTTTLNDGDVLQIATATDAGDLTGTYIESTAPVAVFGGHECADIPYLCSWCRDVWGNPPGGTHRENSCAWCDHLEEQIVPLTTWGKNIMASRVPVRSSGGMAEATFWRVIASEDATTVNITTNPGVTLRFPSGVLPPVTVNRGSMVEFEMVGSAADPGDGLIQADKPVLVMQYIEGQECTNLDAGGGGDPAMIVMVPVEQYLSEYIFLTPNTYEVNYVIITRPLGAVITLDGAPVADAQFLSVAGAWEVARVAVSDGVHHIMGSGPFGIISVGYSPYVSYGYPGGMSLEIINPVI
jgi:hypothetical protein